MWLPLQCCAHHLGMRLEFGAPNEVQHIQYDAANYGTAQRDNWVTPYQPYYMVATVAAAHRCKCHECLLQPDHNTGILGGEEAFIFGNFQWSLAVLLSDLKLSCDQCVVILHDAISRLCHFMSQLFLPGYLMLPFVATLGQYKLEQ